MTNALEEYLVMHVRKGITVEKMEIVKSALKKGYSVEVIKEITGMTIEEYYEEGFKIAKSEARIIAKVDERIEFAKKAFEKGLTFEFIRYVACIPTETLQKLLNNEEEIHKGKIEAKIEIARNALREGATIELVRDITGLTIEEVQKLQAELNAQ